MSPSKVAVFGFVCAVSVSAFDTCAFIGRLVPFSVSLSKQRISMALRSDELSRTKDMQDCPLRPYRSKENNDGMSTATFALG